MNGKDSPINRRDFLRNGTVAVVAANYFGTHPALAHAGPATPSAAADATELMKAAAAGIVELNQFFRRSADEIERERAKAMMERLKDNDLFMKMYQIHVSIILVVIALIITVVTFGAGGSLPAVTAYTAVTATTRLNSLMASLSQLEAAAIGKGIMGSDISDAIVRVRQIVANVKDAVVARDIFFYLSQDKARATSLLEALRAGKRSAVEDMLKRDVAGSTVTVQDSRIDSRLNITVRINNFTYCLSTASQCSGKQLTFRR